MSFLAKTSSKGSSMLLAYVCSKHCACRLRWHARACHPPCGWRGVERWRVVKGPEPYASLYRRRLRVTAPRVIYTINALAGTHAPLMHVLKACGLYSVP